MEPDQEAVNVAGNDVAELAPERAASLEIAAAKYRLGRASLQFACDLQDVTRGMLTIGVGGDDADTARIIHQNVIHSVLERGAFAQVDGVRQHYRVGNTAGALKQLLVCETTSIVDNDDRRGVDPAKLLQQLATQDGRLV